MNVLIIGGSCQGKRAFTSKTFGLHDTQFSDGAELDLDTPLQTPALDHLHILVKRMIDHGRNPDTLLSTLDGHIVICDEIGCGIIPIDAQQEAWREAVGRLCCSLAARADIVYWIRSGIAQCIKERQL